MSLGDKMEGTVIRLLPNKGFGFVRGSDGILRFMHAENVIPRIDFDTMREGQSVLFHSVEFGEPGKQRGNGLRAVNVEVKHS